MAERRKQDPETGDTGQSAARCPVCGRPTLNDTRPFCSRRCADVDLGRWLTGEYRIPGPAIEDAQEEGKEDEA
jgi:endogenous inhibitor of DNA gyrase (YacG/DUF329 family)